MDSVEQFKPGDMVEIVSHKEVEGRGVGSYRHELPMHTPLEVKSGVDSDGDCKVYTPDKSDWWYVPAANLRRVSSAAQPAAEITLNGVRYVLAPEQEPEKAEEKRKPKRGEIWRSVQDGLCLINGDTDEDGDPYVAVLQGSSGCYGPVFLSQMTFAYPSLAAAIEAGEKFT